MYKSLAVVAVVMVVAIGTALERLLPNRHGDEGAWAEPPITNQHGAEPPTTNRVVGLSSDREAQR